MFHYLWGLCHGLHNMHMQLLIDAHSRYNIATLLSLFHQMPNLRHNYYLDGLFLQLSRSALPRRQHNLTRIASHVQQ